MTEKQNRCADCGFELDYSDEDIAICWRCDAQEYKRMYDAVLNAGQPEPVDRETVLKALETFLHDRYGKSVYAPTVKGWVADFVTDYLASRPQAVDDKELDATDLAHPAYWRGEDAAFYRLCQSLTEILDGKEIKGVCSEPYETLRRRIAKLVLQTVDAEVCPKCGWTLKYDKIGIPHGCPDNILGPKALKGTIDPRSSMNDTVGVYDSADKVEDVGWEERECAGYAICNKCGGLHPPNSANCKGRSDAPDRDAMVEAAKQWLKRKYPASQIAKDGNENCFADFALEQLAKHSM